MNFDKIRDKILNRDDRETVTVRTEKKIKRKRDDRGVNIITEPEEKALTFAITRLSLLVLFREKSKCVCVSGA